MAHAYDTVSLGLPFLGCVVKGSEGIYAGLLPARVDSRSGWEILSYGCGTELKWSIARRCLTQDLSIPTAPLRRPLPADAWSLNINSDASPPRWWVGALRLFLQCLEGVRLLWLLAAWYQLH